MVSIPIARSNLVEDKTLKQSQLLPTTSAEAKSCFCAKFLAGSHEIVSEILGIVCQRNCHNAFRLTQGMAS